MAALSLPFCGGCMVLEEYFNAARAIALIERYRVGEILGVPYMFLSILEAPELETADLSSLHAAYVGATASPDWVWRAINEKLHIYDVINAFGGTELTGSTVMTQATDPIEIPMTRVGKLKDCGCAGLPEYGGHLAEYKTVQLSDRRTPAKPNEPGELCSRGVMFQGYFNEPEATRRAIDEDGWYHSGDVGYIDETGYIVLKGRSNDSYKINGELVCPQFLDRQITQAEHVAAVEVVGIPDVKLNAVGAAFVDLTEDTPENRQSVIDWCCEHLGKFEIPKYFIFRPKKTWILTDSGKVPKFRMRELAIELLKAGGDEIVEVTKSKRKGCVSGQEREYAI